eukprot:scaffold8471_cov184-Amphora_coffeaeformis.AAC.19
MGLQRGNETAPTVQEESSTMVPQQSDEGCDDQQLSSQSTHELYMNDDAGNSGLVCFGNVVSGLCLENQSNEIDANLVDGTVYSEAKDSHDDKNESSIKGSDQKDHESIAQLMKINQSMNSHELVDENQFSITGKPEVLTDYFLNFTGEDDTIHSCSSILSEKEVEETWSNRAIGMPVDMMDSWCTDNPPTGVKPDPAGPPKKKVRFQPSSESDPSPLLSCIDDTAAWLAVSNTKKTPPEHVNPEDVTAEHAFMKVKKCPEDLDSKMLPQKGEHTPAYFFTTPENITQDIRGDLHYLGVELDGWMSVAVFESVAVYRQEPQKSGSTYHFATGTAQLQTRLDDPGVHRLVLRDYMTPQCIIVVALVPGTCIHSPPGGGLTLQVRNYTAGSACPLECVIIQASKTTTDQMRAALRQAIAQSVF